MKAVVGEEALSSEDLVPLSDFTNIRVPIKILYMQQ